MRNSAEVPEPYEYLFRAGRSVSGCDPVGGNSARLLPDSNATIDAMVADIDAADPEFRVKPKFAPWVDAVMRFEGPIARQKQHVFAGDWMTYTDEDIDELLEQPIPAPQPGFPAQVVATGPPRAFNMTAPAPMEQ